MDPGFIIYYAVYIIIIIIGTEDCIVLVQLCHLRRAKEEKLTQNIEQRVRTF